MITAYSVAVGASAVKLADVGTASSVTLTAVTAASTIGTTANTTTTNGLVLAAGTSITLPNVTGTLYAVGTTGSVGVLIANAR